MDPYIFGHSPFYFLAFLLLAGMTYFFTAAIYNLLGNDTLTAAGLWLYFGVLVLLTLLLVYVMEPASLRKILTEPARLVLILREPR